MIKFKYNILLLIVILLLYSCNRTDENSDWLITAIQSSEYQIKKASDKYTPIANPRSFESDGSIRLTNQEDWTVGFFPGTLWYMYEITGKEFFIDKAKLFTEGLDSVHNIKSSHDLGFMLCSSYGNGYRLTKDEAYAQELSAGAKTLATRYNSTVGGIRSWDWGGWQFPVIVDNLMNLEILLRAANYDNNEEYSNMALSHADITLKNQFRDDISTYHVIDYDTITGLPLSGSTHQGYSDESTWARGQGWALYGYTLLYEYTNRIEYLETAEKIADFIINHPRLPEDGIPYWDFDHPDIPYTNRDASAGAIYASALLMLSNYVDISKSEQYFEFAEKLLKTLSSAEYLSEVDKNGYFLLKHCVGNFPANSEIDASINYADYYYLEALIRYMNVKGISYNSLLK